MRQKNIPITVTTSREETELLPLLNTVGDFRRTGRFYETRIIPRTIFAVISMADNTTASF
ncbi:hypothetical protein AGR13a_Lc100212 [Agrobacterium genomosp. 13 str. CFBP 6927]|uniref:Uncharacterized protein n=1 Tax=Agrobacterium genomosp. 13 str. CFBP 6927 TaxID=1183428 RepID=A0ABP2BKE5_9HYPH|nr:hypothetical protein AGR13a_Lc100212 [Agrobacterium genomosp. 13 str. CFBP 6927]